MTEISDMQVQRLLAALNPSRFERALERLKIKLWNHNESGFIGFLGDRCDSLQSRSIRWRADSGRIKSWPPSR